MPTFRLTLALHAPVILPTVPPRLETLLQEGLCRLHQDWETEHELPLVYDDDIQGYRNSQLIFATTREQWLTAQQVSLPSSPLRLNLHLSEDVSKRPLTRPYMIKLDGGPNAPRLTRYNAIRSPYAVFYAEGDPQETLNCLQTISAVGKEHMRNYGSFTIMGIESMQSQRWAIRSWPVESAEKARSLVDDVEWIPDKQRLKVGQPDVEVIRPTRVIREPLHA